ncbi:uncharacterized protein LOC143279678 isoform X2 [Babylonia areolata]
MDGEVEENRVEAGASPRTETPVSPPETPVPSEPEPPPETTDASDEEGEEGGESTGGAAQDFSDAETLPASSPPPQLQSPSKSRPETPLLPRLDLTRTASSVFSSVDFSQMDPRFFSIQDISEMETPFVQVPIPDSPTEDPLLPLPLLAGHPAVPLGFGMDSFGMDGSDNGIHSCLSSMRSLASAMSTPLVNKKFKAPDSDAGTDLLPVCRICQLPGDKEDFLFSPCRCSGTMKFVHYLCLLKWIEISTRKTKKTPRCELCHFEYIRHKRFKFTHWRMPRVSKRDKCLHSVFFLNLLVMVTCAVATILCFLSDKGHLQELPRRSNNSSDAQVELTMEEIITLACGIMFFVSFFIAMTVEIKARHTIYRLCLKFISHNTEWQIEPYQSAKDFELNGGPRTNSL